jgi:hypothetical protein
MPRPTDDEVRAALDEASLPAGNGTVILTRTNGVMEYDRALRLARACLILGQPVSDTMSVEVFEAIAERIAAIEARLP